MLFPGLNKETSNIIFTYTPMHGVGYPYIEKAFKNSKFKVCVRFLYELFITKLLNVLFTNLLSQLYQ